MARILVVEDDLELSGVIEDWLMADNHSVDMVHNGQEAQDRLKHSKYDLTITDWQLPVVSGVELCKGYRASGGTMPILMLTGLRAVENRIEGLDAGADDYLTKPFELTELSARVRALLRRPQAAATEITPKATKHVCPQCAKEYPYELTECPDDESELIRAVDDALIGCFFAGKYDIKKLLGWGATSSVYLAEHRDLKKPVAIKLMHSHKLSNMMMIKRFKHEAQTISLLTHQNLVAVHDFGFTEAGEPYLVMDYLEGPDMDDLFAEAQDTGGPMGIDRALAIGLQVLDGLAHAHQKEVIHRDLKPSNIMVVKDEAGVEQVKIVDFGFAKALNIEESMKLTKTGEIFGSPAFMSPEQCMGKVVDCRSDIYAVGCILYQSFTGVQAFDGDNPFDVLRKHVFEGAPPFPPHADVPAAIQREVFKALHREPDQRHQTAAELKQALLQARKQTRKLPVAQPDP